MGLEPRRLHSQPSPGYRKASSSSQIHQYFNLCMCSFTVINSLYDYEYHVLSIVMNLLVLNVPRMIEHAAHPLVLTAPVKIWFCQAADTSWHKPTPAVIYLWAAACFYKPWWRLCESKAFKHFRETMCIGILVSFGVSLTSLFFGFMKRPWIQRAPVFFKHLHS